MFLSTAFCLWRLHEGARRDSNCNGNSMEYSHDDGEMKGNVWEAAARKNIVDCYRKIAVRVDWK